MPQPCKRAARDKTKERRALLRKSAAPQKSQPSSKAARAAQLALVDGAAGLVFAPGGEPRAVFDFVIEHGRIIEINLIADPASIKGLQLSLDE